MEEEECSSHPSEALVMMKRRREGRLQASRQGRPELGGSLLVSDAPAVAFFSKNRRIFFRHSAIQQYIIALMFSAKGEEKNTKPSTLLCYEWRTKNAYVFVS